MLTTTLTSRRWVELVSEKRFHDCVVKGRPDLLDFRIRRAAFGVNPVRQENDSGLAIEIDPERAS